MGNRRMAGHRGSIIARRTQCRQFATRIYKIQSGLNLCVCACVRACVLACVHACVPDKSKALDTIQFNFLLYPSIDSSDGCV